MSSGLFACPVVQLSIQKCVYVSTNPFTCTSHCVCSYQLVDTPSIFYIRSQVCVSLQVSLNNHQSISGVGLSMFTSLSMCTSLAKLKYNSFQVIYRGETKNGKFLLMLILLKVPLRYIIKSCFKYILSPKTCFTRK